MLKRLATLLLGIGLIGLGALLFVAPGGSVVLQWLTKLWPIFLILAGLVRVFGYLIDRHPRSPVGGMMITAIGGILLAANLRGENSILLLIGQYWFFLLLALIVGRVLWQYTHRMDDGKRPRAFAPGAIFLMVLLVGGGLTSNYLAKNRQYLNGVQLKLGHFNFFNTEFSVENDAPVPLILSPESRLVIGNFKGDVEISAISEASPSARLIKRIRANNQEEANQIAPNIQLQISPVGKNLQFSVRADNVQNEFSGTLIINLPQQLNTGVEVSLLDGGLKLVGLRGDHLIRNCNRIEISNNTGKLTIENSQSSTKLSNIQGDVSLSGIRGNLSLREITGAITLEAAGGNATIEESSGTVQARIKDTRLTINNLAMNSSTQSNQPAVKLSEAGNSRINLQEIKGAVIVNAERSRIDAENIIGDLTVKNSSERVQVNQINGALKINAENSTIAVEEVKGSAEIETTRNDVTVQGFRGALSVTTTTGAINLSTEEKLAGNIKATTDRGRIRVSIPEDSGFKLDARTERGRLTINGFTNLDVPSRQKQILQDYNFSTTSPVIVLRSSRGDLDLQSSGLALASRDE